MNIIESLKKIDQLEKQIAILTRQSLISYVLEQDKQLPRYKQREVLDTLLNNSNASKRHYAWMIAMGFTARSAKKAVQSHKVYSLLRLSYKEAGLSVPADITISMSFSCHRQDNDRKPLFRKFPGTMLVSAFV